MTATVCRARGSCRLLPGPHTESGRLAVCGDIQRVGWRPRVCVSGRRRAAGKGRLGKRGARNGSKSRAGGAIAERICQVRTYTDARALLLGARVTPAWFGGFVISLSNVMCRRRPLHRRRMRARSQEGRSVVTNTLCTNTCNPKKSEIAISCSTDVAVDCEPGVAPAVAGRTGLASGDGRGLNGHSRYGQGL